MNSAAHRVLRIFSAVLVVIGILLSGGGARLAMLGGSYYYLLAGAGSIACGVLLPRRRRAALWLYAVILGATLVWAVAEVGFDFFQIGPRLDLWVTLGLLLLWPPVNRRVGGADAVRRGDNIPLAAACVLAIGAFIVAVFCDYHRLPGEVPAAEMAALGGDVAPYVAPNDWGAWGRSGYGNRYSPATQITPKNVAKLELAWTFHTGDLKGPNDPFEITNEVTPLKVNGKLYLCTPHNIVVALDPDTGKELWRYDPKLQPNLKRFQHLTCRGVSYYDADAYAKAETPRANAEDAADSARRAAREACPRRIFTSIADARVIALNADDGKPCAFFGNQGVVDLKAGQGGRAAVGYLIPTSPPTVTRRVLIVASAVTDNYSTDEPSGVIYGFDIDSGKLVWNWDSANPDATEPLAPGQSYTRSSPNSWITSSVDEALGLVYIPMGNQTPDIWGGNRTLQSERYASSIVALDIATGKLRWAYQTVHHDRWDHDVPSQPTLVDIDEAQGRVPAVIVPTKVGNLFVLDRRTGKLLVPAAEKPAPQGAAAGDHTEPTQPISELNFIPPRAREADMWGATPFDQLICRIEFKSLDYQGQFTPPSERGILAYPGNLGVFEWGGAAVDPIRQLLILNPNYMGFVMRLHRRDGIEVKEGDDPGGEAGLQPMKGTPFAVDIHAFLSPLKMPCQAPPWGYKAVVDLRTMKTVWMRKAGTALDSVPGLPFPFGFPSMGGFPVGVPSLGGSVVTGSGIFFNAGTLDYYLRAYDVRDGRELWKGRLPAGGQATPMTYISEKTGRQYVVVMAGGHGSLGTRMGDSLVAYALPQNTAAPAK